MLALTHTLTCSHSHPLNPLSIRPFRYSGKDKPLPKKADWVELRLAVFARDNHQCIQCGSTKELQVHHHHPRRQNGTNQMDNLQTLCRNCHARTPSWGRPPGTGSTQSRRAG
ncbi:MAG: hypothetical protein CL608_24670 [Anaerolineaceae bacterium]|nr:hypothetical protein [Anaerolineaceae bacterium]